jgi:multidrug resistance efflux pump
MADEDKTIEIQAKLDEANTQLATAQETTKATQASLDEANTGLETSKARESVLEEASSVHEAEMTRLKGELEASASVSGELVTAKTELEAATKKADALEEKQSKGLRERLEAYGIERANLTDQSITVLEAMEVGALAARPKGRELASGGGLGGGGSDTTAPQTMLERATLEMNVMRENPNGTKTVAQ